jgi:putative transposase
MKSVNEMSNYTSIVRSCSLLGIPRSSFYYYFQPRRDEDKKGHQTSDKFRGYKIPEEKRAEILDILNSDEFFLESPYEIFYTMLDRDRYLCSIRSMYRILKEFENGKFVRVNKRKKTSRKPVLCAREPNQVWSWDITYLKGNQRGLFYYLYVMLDIFSRYVVGWMIECHDNAILAKHFINNCCLNQKINEKQLTIHSDRGSSMRSSLVVDLVEKLGIEKSYSRPRVPNDNPYSESHFSTMKRGTYFPMSFDDIESARDYCTKFFTWYNNKHYHFGLNGYTAYSVHCGEANEIYRKRLSTIDSEIQKSDNPYVKRVKIKKFPSEVWINKPIIENSEDVTGADAFSIAEVTSSELIFLNTKKRVIQNH